MISSLSLLALLARLRIITFSDSIRTVHSTSKKDLSPSISGSSLRNGGVAGGRSSSSAPGSFVTRRTLMKASPLSLAYLVYMVRTSGLGW